MGKFVDSIIALRILNLLVTPFDQTDAFKRGIIDAKGKELKRMRDLHSVEDRDAYTLLHRLVFRLKKIIEKLPIENKKLSSLAAAYSLIREQLIINKEPVDFETQFLQRLKEDLSTEIEEVQVLLNENKMFTFRQFTEEMGAGGMAPANNAAASQGVAGLGKDVPVSKKAQKRYTSGNAGIIQPMYRRGKVS